MEDRLTSSGLQRLWSKVTTYINYRINSNNDSIADMIYPVGSIYMSMNNTNPETLFGGTWEKLAGGRCLVNTGYLDDDGSNESERVELGKYGGYKDTQLVNHDHEFNHRHYLNNDLIMPGTSNSGQHGYLTYVLNSGVSRFKVAPSTASNARYVLGGKSGANSAENSGLTFSSYQNQMSGTTTKASGGVRDRDNNANYQPYIGVNMWKRTA